MAGIKKISINEATKILINKMLEKYNVDYDYIFDNQEIDGVPWYQYYTWTQEESDKYKEFFIDFLRHNIKPKFLKKQAIREWDWFNLMYGLKIKDENRL